MTITTLLVDDESPARDELQYLLSHYEEIEIIGETESAGKAIAFIQRHRPDLIFLDIQMPGRSGFDVIAELGESLDYSPIYVFVTAYDNYAIKAFEQSALDYILKPVSKKRLDKTIARVKKILVTDDKTSFNDSLKNLLNQFELPTRNVVKISIEVNNRIQLLVPDEIVYCSYESNRILVHTKNQSFPLHGNYTMDKLSQHLLGTSFFRIHRAILVNLDWIQEFSPWFNGKYNLIMNDSTKTELTVSRTRVKEFKQCLGI